MTMWGADVDALDALARRLIATAEQLNTARMTTRALLYGTGWFGHDADTFRQQWEGPHTAAFHAAIASLGAAADLVKHDAAEQRRASGDEGGSGAALAGVLAGAGFLGGLVPSGDPGEPGQWRDGTHWYEPWTWLRERPAPSVDSTMHTSPQPLFSGTPTPSDVRQGQLRDCYLASAAASVANADPERIRQMVTDNHDGTYTVSFHNSNGGIDKVTVDGKLYTHGGIPAYGQPTNDQWFPIVEKAYAKWKGDYTTIGGQGGNPTGTLAALTGDQTHADPLFGSTGMSNGDAFKQIQGSIDSHHPITASTYNTLPDSHSSIPLFGDHAYSVIGYKTSPDGSQWVQVRNPWGSSPNPDGVGYVSIDEFRKYFGYLEWTS